MGLNHMTDETVRRAEKRLARRDKKKHPTMKVTGRGTKRLATQLTQRP